MSFAGTIGVADRDHLAGASCPGADVDSARRSRVDVDRSCGVARQVHTLRIVGPDSQRGAESVSALGHVPSADPCCARPLKGLFGSNANRHPVHRQRLCRGRRVHDEHDFPSGRNSRRRQGGGDAGRRLNGQKAAVLVDGLGCGQSANRAAHSSVADVQCGQIECSATATRRRNASGDDGARGAPGDALDNRVTEPGYSE